MTSSRGYDNRTMADVDACQFAEVEALRREVARLKAERVAIGAALRDKVFYTMGTRTLSPAMHAENEAAIDEAVRNLLA